MPETDVSRLAEQEPVKAAIQRARRHAKIQEKEPVALYGLIATLASLAVVVVAVLVAKDNKGAALIIGIVGVAATMLAQIYLIRQKVWSPTSLAQVIKAYLGGGGKDQKAEERPTVPAGHGGA